MASNMVPEIIVLPEENIKRITEGPLVFLSDAEYITGQVIKVDGGRSIS